MPDSRPVALVTGSTSGIGEAVARRFAAGGFGVVLNSARSVDAGKTLSASLPHSMYRQADIADHDQVRDLVDETIATFGRLDVLVNNAGRTRPIPHGDLDSVTQEDWQRILGLNVVGTWNLSVAAMPALRRSAGGAIVNISSIAGSRPAGSSIPYAVSKAAVEHMTRLLAAVVGPEVRVNAVAPGLIDTPWTAGFTEIKERVATTTALRRVGLPGDVADAVFALSRAEYTTGTVLYVDGGAHLA
ncbi:SDR family oxidoreductase [Actinomadura graeca]|uniref:SDR family oxidoreductase n=1 Tax=Actinomadura graeca TaxID=2750812 RepID=A0ABX8QYZ6_9ACTN|nr:SDR family oxidoreductase [Actinomadura graeca]QXJ23404.1 SDR family oxidoreductase [Actinomadura graeca]